MKKSNIFSQYYNILNFFSILFSIVLTGFTFASLHKGIPWSDEAMQILPLYKFLLGQSSFIDEYSFLQLPSLLVYPFFKIYYYLNHFSIKGLFIFERRFYTCIAILCCTALTCLLKKSIPFSVALLISINLVSFTPFGLHSPGYDNFPMLFLTLSFFFFAFSSQQNNSKIKKWLIIGAGIFQGLAITVYPIILIYLPLMFLFLYQQSKFQELKFYLTGLILGSSWIILIGLSKISSILYSIKWNVSSHQPGGFLYLKNTLIWYGNIAYNLKFSFIGFLILKFTKTLFFRKYYFAWEILIIVCLLSFIVFLPLWPEDYFETHGRGMAYTVAFFSLTPFLFLYLYSLKLPQQLFKIWISSLLLFPFIAFSSLSQGLSTVIVLFPGALVCLIFIYMILTEVLQSSLFIQKISQICAFFLIFIIAAEYQMANWGYFYGELSGTNVSSHCFSKGALLSLCSTKGKVQLLNNLEKALRPISIPQKTLAVFGGMSVAYFFGNFSPYIDGAYVNNITSEFRYYKEREHYPDVLIRVAPFEYILPNDIQNALSSKYSLYTQNKDFTIYLKLK